MFAVRREHVDGAGRSVDVRGEADFIGTLPGNRATVAAIDQFDQVLRIRVGAIRGEVAQIVGQFRVDTAGGCLDDSVVRSPLHDGHFLDGCRLGILAARQGREEDKREENRGGWPRAARPCARSASAST